MMTSSTSSGFTCARSSAPLIAALPRSCAGTVPRAPLNEPTGVRAALAMTMSVMKSSWARHPKSRVYRPALTSGKGASAPHRRQRLESLPIAPAEIHFGAVLQANAPVAAHPRCHFRHAGNVHDRGFMHADEPFGIELALQSGERRADLESVGADMQDGVVARRLDPVDVGHLDHDLAAATLAHGEALGWRCRRTGSR